MQVAEDGNAQGQTGRPVSWCQRVSGYARATPRLANKPAPKSFSTPRLVIIVAFSGGQTLCVRLNYLMEAMMWFSAALCDPANSMRHRGWNVEAGCPRQHGRRQDYPLASGRELVRLVPSGM